MVGSFKTCMKDRETRLDCVGLGYHCKDIILRIPYVPSSREQNSVSVLQFSMQGGGPVSTGIVTMAKLGAAVGYLGKVGDDLWGEYIIEEYKHYSVDTSHITVEKDKTSPCVVVLVDAESGKRAFLKIPSNLSGTNLGESEAKYIGGSRMLFIGYEEPEREFMLVEAAKVAKSRGIPVILDGVPVGELENLVNIAICGEKQAYEIAGTRDPTEAIERLSSKGCKITGITLGVNGSIFKAEDKIIRQKAFPIEVVDTTGAGDVFHGAFAFGILQEWSIERIAEFASAVSAIKCTKLGGRAGIPSLEEALAFLKERGSSFF